MENGVAGPVFADAKLVNKVSGQPFTIAEIEAAIESALS
jgi:hypothetical protein